MEGFYNFLSPLLITYSPFPTLSTHSSLLFSLSPSSSLSSNSCPSHFFLSLFLILFYFLINLCSRPVFLSYYFLFTFLLGFTLYSLTSLFLPHLLSHLRIYLVSEEKKSEDRGNMIRRHKRRQVMKKKRWRKKKGERERNKKKERLREDRG